MFRFTWLRNWLRNFILPFELKYELIHPEAKPPTRSTEWASAYDLYTPIPVTIASGEQIKINIGVKMTFSPGWAAQIWDRSGLGNKGIAKHAGLLDPDYPGEWGIVLRNHHYDPISFNTGERIAQVCFVPCGQAVPYEGEVVETTDRKGGFGSTGK